jgi:hypothetical protein
VSAPRIHLSQEEGRWLRRILLGDEEVEEVRLLARVARGRVLCAVRTDTGPLRALPAGMPARRPRDLRALPGCAGVDRAIAIDAARACADPDPDLFARLTDPGVAADPPWCPALDSLRPVIDRLGSLLLPDGAYALASPPAEGAGWRVVCTRLHAGRPELVSGGQALGIDRRATLSDLCTAFRRRVAAPQLVVSAPEPELRALLSSGRPLSALERATIRGEVEVAQRSPRVAAALHALRLLEPLLDRARTRARRRPATSAR